jgi:integrase
MSRRSFGTVRQLPSGRWQARYFLDDGRRETAPVTFRTRKDALHWLASLEADMARGRWVDPDGGRELLGQFAWAWLAGKPGLSRRTREIYALQLRLHILPAQHGDVPLGEVSLGELNSEMIRAWYRALTDSRGESVAAKAYVRLRQVLTQAVDDERIVRNPCRIARGGRERHAEQRFLDLATLDRLASHLPPRYRVLVLVAGLGGLRQGELFALRRADVDLGSATIRVYRKRLRLASGEVIEDGPKSRAGHRSVTLPRSTIDELRRHLDSYAGPKPDDYVFTTGEGAPLERSNMLHRVWAPATAAAGLTGLRFHDLRHTAGTLAAQTGATTKELMARLGHASPAAAMVYQHAAADRDRLIADRLEVMTQEAQLAGTQTSPDGRPGTRRSSTS